MVRKRSLHKTNGIFLQFTDPLVFIGSKNGIGRVVVFQDIVCGKNHLVLEKVKRDTAGCQQAFYFPVTLHGVRFVVFVGIHRPDAELLRKRFPDFERNAFLAKQAAGGIFCRDCRTCRGCRHCLAGAFLNGTGEAQERLVDEGDPGIVGLQLGKDVFIKNENGQNGERSAQGFLQTAVVFQAQVPSEPEYRDCLHIQIYASIPDNITDIHAIKIKTAFAAGSVRRKDHERIV